MTKEKLCSIAAAYFPGYTGIMLTGSQVDHSEIYTGADVDILIFHPDYGSLYNRKIKHGGYKLDFTLAPLFDLENTLFNQGNDINGTLLSMIVNGAILFDTADVLKQVQQQVQSVYSQVSFNTQKEYGRLVKELKRMRKVFEGNLTAHERVIVACEFVSTVTAIETIRIRKWRPTIKHRARLLYDKNRELTGHLVEIVQNAVRDGDVGSIDRFFGYYDKLREQGMDLPVRAGGSLIAEMSFVNFSFPWFAEKVLPVIRRHSLLGDGYRYYYASLSNYWPTYRHEVCVLFDAGDPEKAMEMTEELERILGMAGLGLLESSVIYPKKRGIDEAFNGAIEQLNAVLCQWHTDLLQGTGYVQDRWLWAMALCSYLGKGLDLSRNDLIRANLFLSQRWLLRQSELKKLDSYDSLKEFRIEIYRVLKGVFNKKGSLLPVVMTLEIPLPIRTLLDSMITDKGRYSATFPFLSTILGLLNIASPADVFVYITIAEEAVQLLNLSNEQKNWCFYFLNEAIDHPSFD